MGHGRCHSMTTWPILVFFWKMFSQASQQLVIDKPARLGSERNAKLWVQMMPQGWFKRNYAPVQSGPTFFSPCRMCMQNAAGQNFDLSRSFQRPFLSAEVRHGAEGVTKEDYIGRLKHGDSLGWMSSSGCLASFATMKPVQKSSVLMHLQGHWCRNWSARLTGLSWVLHRQSRQ